MKYKELLNKLPNDWQDIKLKDYIKLVTAIEQNNELRDEIIYTEGFLKDMDTNLTMASILLDVPVDALEKDLTMVQLAEVVSKLSFMNEIPKTVKPTIKYKTFEQLSYDDFITFEKYKVDAFVHLDKMLSIFSKDNLPPKYFLEVNMNEALAGFFLLSQNTTKYLNNLKVSLSKQLLMIKMKEVKKTISMFFCKKVRA